MEYPYICHMSHTALTYHFVIGTYRREHTIDIEHERELYKFMNDYMAARGALVRRIGGMPDHIHVLCDIPSKIAVAAFVQTLKTESSKFMRANPHFPYWRGWCEGYGAFTVDASSRDTRKHYIMNQKRHHLSKSFWDEYVELMAEAGIMMADMPSADDCVM